MWFTNGHIVDTKTGEIHRNRHINVGPDGRISAIQMDKPSGPSHDLEGRYVLPGIISCHTHLSVVFPFRDTDEQENPAITAYRAAQRAQEALKAGITTLRCVHEQNQIDLFLIHWPLPTLYDGDFVSTWRTLGEFVADGRARSIGVSNFQPAHLDRIVAETGVVPAVNQIEVHPYFANEEARAGSHRHGVAVEAWSPIAQGAVLDDETIGKVAAVHGRTASQVTLRWHVQRGDIVFPKSMRRERMEENFAIFDFELSEDEMTAISGLDRGEAGRTGPNPDVFDYVPE